MIKLYKKVKAEIKYRELMSKITDLYHIKEKVEKSLSNKCRCFTVDNIYNHWGLARKLFGNEGLNYSRRDCYYYINYVGLIKLKLLIWFYERKVRDYNER